MSTKEDWMAAVAAEKCTVGLLEYVRNIEEAQKLAKSVRAREVQMEFGLEELTKTRKPVRPGPRPKTDRKG